MITLITLGSNEDIFSIFLADSPDWLGFLLKKMKAALALSLHVHMMKEVVITAMKRNKNRVKSA